MYHRTFSILFVITLAGAISGCGQTPRPQFRLDMTNVVDKQLALPHQEQIANILGAMFGTPDKPFAMSETGLNQRRLDMAAGPVRSTDLGAKHGLYRRHCAHCHGISGDGRGPTAGILNPYPRDYRKGLFKFKGTQYAAKPTREDLKRIVHDGIPGTAMPSFALLPPDEVDALIEYVKYLSIRGQMETALENYVFDEGLEPEQPVDLEKDEGHREAVMGMLSDIATPWQEASEQVIVPDESAIPPAERTPEQIAESVAKGRELFYSATKGNCLQCHGPTGLGDGQQTDFDDWSKINKAFIDNTASLEIEIGELQKNLGQLNGDERKEADAELEAKAAELKQRREWVAHLLPPRNAIPRNLRDGSYRGGRRPIDIFWRIYAGIPGMPMPGTAQTAEGGTGLTQEEIWQIVDYVHSLPFEPVSRPQKRPRNVEAVN
jgi:mono/diheme cytochrome c family protein